MVGRVPERSGLITMESGRVVEMRCGVVLEKEKGKRIAALSARMSVEQANASGIPTNAM